IRLFNSLTQRKEEFVPRDEGRVGIYACGPTVYNLVHVGNARPYVVFAVLRSWLRSRGYEVTLVENITDVNDKINAKADAEGRGPAEVAAEFTAAYIEDTDRLGVPRPDVEPKASEMIPEIVDLVCQLESSGHAYPAPDGSVYFRVRSFAGYGKLSGQRIDELEEEARVEAEPGKEDPLDFAVWKAAKPGEREHLWESPWGLGRPGWHIECSAMSLRYLGRGFDIHGGGRDLIFPHHENEIAQSEAAGLPFARIWMHNGMIRNEGDKMAKSVGNIFLLREVLDRYPAAVVLTYFLTTHYRSPLEFSIAKLDEARAAYERLAEAVRTAGFREDHPGAGETHDATALRAATAHAREAFAEQMDDDLNTAAAFGELFGLARELFRYVGAADAAGHAVDTEVLEDVEDLLVECLDDLCIALPDDVFASAAAGAEAAPDGAAPEVAVRGSGELDGEACVTDEVPLPPAARLAAEERWDDLAALVDERLACGDASYACLLRDHHRSQKDWAQADALRGRIEAAGFEVRDTPAGTQVVHKG
ncbi:MAG TPA: cysteine--tRNA ligase, partial [Thermoleophilia bacterium]|nr:cysteine--tRNA ligase [Thermoleophilia bacterium]